MFGKSLAAIAALTAIALLATTVPSSVTDAKELKASLKKQGNGLPLPAVQKVRRAAEGIHKSKPGGSDTIKLGGSRAENQSKSPTPKMHLWVRD